MSAKSPSISSASSSVWRSMLWFWTTITSCIPSPTNRSRMIETTSCSRPPASGLRRKKAAEKYSTLPDESRSGRTPFTFRRSTERKRVSSVEKPWVRRSMSPTSSQMQKVEPARIVSCGTSTPGVPDRAALGECFDDELVDVDVRRPGQHEDDAFRDVLGAEGVEAFVRGLRLLLVAAEAHAREVRLDEAGVDGRQ